ncbi:hypothetical protein BDZ97DRAFT_1763397 [Flammula alnicola]|nr:hypothetical protein BDZ97DRAFT_1763397 [Flammula alnicola]
MSIRPAKRRRTDNNIFVDLEAVADDVLEDDELTDGEEELEVLSTFWVADEMDEEETRWDSVVSHARLRQAMTDRWSEEPHLLDDLLQRATRRAAMERGRTAEDVGFSSEYAAADYTLFEDDNLWEIGCKLFPQHLKGASRREAPTLATTQSKATAAGKKDTNSAPKADAFALMMKEPLEKRARLEQEKAKMKEKGKAYRSIPPLTLIGPQTGHA